MSEEISILIRLIIAHLLTDFVLQPPAWIQDRQQKKYRSSKLYLHAFITAVVAYLLAGLWNIWWLPAIIFISHLGIDIWKSYQPLKLRYFLIDQLLHFLFIALVWIILFNKWDDTGILLSEIYGNSNYLTVLAIYIVAAWPLGILIGIATEKWRNELVVNSDGLAKAGMWIGLLERFLILTFILINQYTAIGFLIAAKSILRFSDKESSTQKKTEYVLIGALMSFSATLLLGLIMNALLKIHLI